MVKYEKKSMEKLQEEAEEGSSEAQSALGLLNELGLMYSDSTMNFLEALQWYEEAAKGGDYLAALSAATIYKVGAPGIEPSSEKAEFYFNIAAKLGFDKPENRIEVGNKATIAGKKVLIIDHPGPQRNQMHQELISFGFNPIDADGLAAAQGSFLKYQDIHCIFVDLDISKPNPITLLEGIRKIRLAKELPIVVVTTITDVQVIKLARKHNISGWLLKPVKDKLVGKAARRLA